MSFLDCASSPLLVSPLEGRLESSESYLHSSPSSVTAILFLIFSRPAFVWGLFFPSLKGESTIIMLKGIRSFTNVIAK